MESTRIADELRSMLESKYQRELERGRITRAEYETLCHRVRQDSADREFQSAIAELARKQRQLAEDAVKAFEWEAGVAAVTSIVSLGLDIRKYERTNAVIDVLSSLYGGYGLSQSLRQNAFLLSDDDYLAAIQQAEQRIEGRPLEEAMPGRVALRVRSFFDQWCLDNQVDRYRLDPNHEHWVRRYRRPFQDRCHLDFDAFLGVLEEEGWRVPGPSLRDYGWQCLRADSHYLAVFGRDQSGVYTFTAARLLDHDQMQQYTFRFQDHRDGTARATLLLPAEIELADLPKVGLPASREVVFPLQARIDRHLSRETSFDTSGREIHAYATGYLKGAYGAGVSLASLFGGDSARMWALVEQTEARNCLFRLLPVSEEADALRIEFSAVLIVPDEQLSRMQQANGTLSAHATRVP